MESDVDRGKCFIMIPSFKTFCTGIDGVLVLLENDMFVHLKALVQVQIWHVLWDGEVLICDVHTNAFHALLVIWRVGTWHIRYTSAQVHIDLCLVPIAVTRIAYLIEYRRILAHRIEVSTFPRSHWFGNASSSSRLSSYMSMIVR